MGPTRLWMRALIFRSAQMPTMPTAEMNGTKSTAASASWSATPAQAGTGRPRRAACNRLVEKSGDIAAGRF